MALNFFEEAEIFLLWAVFRIVEVMWLGSHGCLPGWQVSPAMGVPGNLIAQGKRYGDAETFGVERNSAFRSRIFWRTSSLSNNVPRAASSEYRLQARAK
uniref:Uncharacterized protein n=1 Tax=Candidatus Kentrum sp. LFY TaxID=2126342 RepID=A0A450UX60_9GAMM|nr:MAG: hypothetical protein BECKLFY1418B_GA0070995_10953 [Candidatus Kentron sp. LFY]